MTDEEMEDIIRASIEELDSTGPTTKIEEALTLLAAKAFAAGMELAYAKDDCDVDALDYTNFETWWETIWIG